MKKIFLALFAIIFAIFFIGCDDAKTPVKKAHYSLSSLKGQKISFTKKEDALSTNGNKPYLLVFLSSWCDYCLGQAQHIANLNAEFEGKINIYGVFVDKDEEKATLEKFVAESSTKFEWFYKGDIAKLVGDYQIQTFPFMLLYDKNGALIASYDGLTPEEMIAFNIKQILEE